MHESLVTEWTWVETWPLALGQTYFIIRIFASSEVYIWKVVGATWMWEREVWGGTKSGEEGSEEVWSKVAKAKAYTKWSERAREGGRHSSVRFYEIKGHIVTGITSIRKRRIQDVYGGLGGREKTLVELTLFVCSLCFDFNISTMTKAFLYDLKSIAPINFFFFFFMNKIHARRTWIFYHYCFYFLFTLIL